MASVGSESNYGGSEANELFRLPNTFAVRTHCRINVGRDTAIFVVRSPCSSVTQTTIGAFVFPRVNDQLVAIEVVVSTSQLGAFAVWAGTNNFAITGHVSLPV